MNENKIKIMFGVNIAISCLGIFMIYKATQVNNNVDASVTTYLDGKTSGELKTLIDAAVSKIKQDNGYQITNAIDTAVKKYTTDKIVEEMVKEKIEEKIEQKVQEAVDALVIDITTNDDGTILKVEISN